MWGGLLGKLDPLTFPHLMTLDLSGCQSLQRTAVIAPLLRDKPIDGLLQLNQEAMGEFRRLAQQQTQRHAAKAHPGIANTISQ